MAENEKCKDCGCEMTQFVSCTEDGSVYHHHVSGWIECLRNQLAAANAKLAEKENLAEQRQRIINQLSAQFDLECSNEVVVERFKKSMETWKQSVQEGGEAQAAAMREALDSVLGHDEGILGDYGGGNVSWWHGYIRAIIDRMKAKAVYDTDAGQSILDRLHAAEAPWQPLSKAPKNQKIEGLVQVKDQIVVVVMHWLNDTTPDISHDAGWYVNYTNWFGQVLPIVWRPLAAKEDGQ